jgi:hypothetical protein
MTIDYSASAKPEAQEFYRTVIGILNDSGIPFMLGGAFATFHYTGIYRDTKDLDVFCKPSDHIKLLKLFAGKGYQTELTDERWLCKVFSGDFFIDIIFSSVNNICRVDDTWLEKASAGQLHGMNVNFLPAEELFWCKIYVQNRERYDGADLNHLILRYGHKLDWKRILMRLDHHWHLLFQQLINFQFVYPGERDIIPKWLFDNMMERASEQFDHPPAIEKVCRGPIIDNTQYQIDVKDWEYKALTIKTV